MVIFGQSAQVAEWVGWNNIEAMDSEKHPMYHLLTDKEKNCVDIMSKGWPIVGVEKTEKAIDYFIRSCVNNRLTLLN